MGNWFTDTLDGVGSAIGEAQQFLERLDPLSGTPFGGPALFDVSGDEGPQIGRPTPAAPGEGIGGPVGEAVTRGTERFFQAYEYVYDNAVSQPISTAALMMWRPNRILSASEWSRTWEAAEYISPGQALTLPYAAESGGEQLLGMTPLGIPLAPILGDTGHAQRAVDSPLVHYEPPASMLPPEWDQLSEQEKQQVLRDIGMPVDPRGGNAYVAALRDRSLGFRQYSGAYDFAARWFGDPLVIGGKAIRTAREATTVIRRPQGGWTQPRIDQLMSSSRMSQLVRFLDENRGNPALINNSDMARNSAMGPRLGAINEVLTNADEVRDFIRVGMGDVRAEERLRTSNALAAARLDSGYTRMSQLDMLYARYASSSSPNLANLVERQRQRLQSAIDADEAMVSRYGQILEHVDELDQLYLSGRQYRAAQTRTEAQRAYIAGPARNARAPRQFRAKITPPIARAGTEIRVSSAFYQTKLWGVGDFFTAPVTFIRGMQNVHPNGYLELDNARALDQSNVNELRAQLSRIPGLGQGERQNRLNQYLRLTSEGERKIWLDQLHADAMGRIARKYGLNPKAGQAIFRESQRRRVGLIDDMRQYSATPNPGTVRVDTFVDEGGLAVHPHTVSRLVNNHVLEDLTEFDRVLRRHSSFLRGLWESGGDEAADFVVRAGDSLNSLWKFGTLFRIGYIFRAPGDELASQVARLGAAIMAMRAGYGVRNAVTNIAHRNRRAMAEVEARTHEDAVQLVEQEIGEITRRLGTVERRAGHRYEVARRSFLRAEDRLTRAEARLAALPADATPGRRRAAERFLEAKRSAFAAADRATADLRFAQGIDISALRTQVRFLEDSRARATERVAELRREGRKRKAGRQQVQIGGTYYPAAFEPGQRGDYWMQRISPQAAYDQLLKSNQQLIYSNIVRSFDHGARPIQAIDDQAKHAEAWSHAINAQIAGDALERRLIEGVSDAEAARWLRRDPKGRAYWERLGLQAMETPDGLVARLRAEVDEYLPTAEIRAQALTPEGVTPDFLRKALPNPATRPTVHMANLANNVAQQAGLRSMNKVFDTWYNFAVNMPSRFFSRHPLFNQLYEGHLKAIVRQRANQGATPRTVDEVERVAETARRIAERDMKRLVFDISHRSDVSAALRWISPFFSATAESFQRWARVIADKPETLGYAAKFYNAPAYMGMLQTSDGNPIFPDGTYIDPVTGERKLASKNERWIVPAQIVTRLPSWVLKSPLGTFLGAEPASGNVMLSQNSINMVTQGDPWFNPGVGPIVTIPVQEFVRDKPDQAELARHLGILPFGPSTSESLLQRTAQAAAPGAVRNFLTAFDTSDYRYQQIKMQITQRAIWKHENNPDIPMPSAQEIADQTRNYWLWSAASSFMQPAASQRKDPYEFYRQQYRNLQRTNPENADLEFLNRFGEEYFIFAQQMSKHEAGVPATKRAVELSQEYADLLAENPELGSLIIGPEGNGPFSPEAYAYQLNTPIEPGGAEAQRRRLSASEMLAENQRRLGWAKYTALMNGLRAELEKRNLQSFSQEGAEDLNIQREAFIMMYGEPTTLEGEENPYYNEEWSKDWHSLDARKYERMIPALTRVSRKLLERDPDRSDLRMLQTYLAGREAIQQALTQREFTTLGAQANTDLRTVWATFVDGLTERDTTFGDLHSRYLSRDLGVDIDEEMALMQSVEELA